MPNFHISLMSESKKDFAKLVQDVGQKFFLQNTDQLADNLQESKPIYIN